MFFEHLQNRIDTVESLLCVGLDPHTKDASTVDEAENMCRRLIDETAQYAAAFKPNSAFFEMYGGAGLNALRNVIAHVPDQIPVILDAKRGDIASTAEAYAAAAFDFLGAGCITLHPYLGADSVEPFLRHTDHAAFVLCKTSNPAASELQDLVVQPRSSNLTSSNPTESSPLFLEVARHAAEWGAKYGDAKPENAKQGNCGLVIGATQPDAIAAVRAQDANVWILAPGVGAQGGNLEAALRAGLRHDRSGILFPVSRGISRAPDPRAAARTLRDTINRLRAANSPSSDRSSTSRSGALEASTSRSDSPAIDKNRRQLACQLLEKGCVRFGSFTLKSGQTSPIYIDLRRLVAHPQLMQDVAHALGELLAPLKYDHIAALPYAALPIGTATALHLEQSLIYPRREAKAYGTKAQVEGVFEEGDTAVVLDDLTTTGLSKFEAFEKLQEVGLDVQDVVILIDRQGGAAENLAHRGFRLHAVFTLDELLGIWSGEGLIDAALVTEVQHFVAESRSNAEPVKAKEKDKEV